MNTMPEDFGNRPLDQWKTTELKQELKRRKIGTSGSKGDLVKRLDEALRNEEAEQSELTDAACNPKDCDAVQNYQNHDRNEESVTCEKNLNPNMSDEDQEGRNLSGGEAESDINGAESDSNPKQLLSFSKSCGEDELKPEVSDVRVKIGAEAEELSDPLTHQVSEKVSPVDVGFQVKCESVNTDSVSIIEENELKDSLNVDNNVNFESEVVVKRRNFQESTRYVEPRQRGDDGSESLAQRVQAGVGPEVKGTNGDDHGDCKLNDESRLVGHQDGSRSPSEDNFAKNLAQNVRGDERTEDKLGVNKESKIDDEIHVVKSLREDDGSDAMVIDVCNDDKKEVDVSGNVAGTVAEKRKNEDEGVGLHEPVKRARRWNVGNRLTGDVSKVPTTERELPAYLAAASGAMSASTAAMRARPSTMKPALSRSDSVNNGDSQKERIVPLSQKASTNSLKIDRFLRPFTLKAVRELLAKTGTVTNFWMDHIKTHCYVTYSSVEEAVATRNALYNLQWPRNGGRQLIAEYVDPEEVKLKVEGPPEALAPVPVPAHVPGPVNAPPRSISAPHNHMPFKPSLQGAGPPQHAQPPPPSLPLPPPPPLPPASRERQPLPLKKVEQPVHTLDDLFKKTRTTPRIYYLPLSEEEVSAKLAARARDRNS